MRSYADYSIYNTQYPDALAPKSKKAMPFPLENFDSQIAEAYAKMNTILGMIKAAEQNPVNHTDARKARLDSLKYKTKSALSIIQTISKQAGDLWY